LTDAVTYRKSTIKVTTQHLEVLKDAGLIRGDVDGPRVCYCIEPYALRRLRVLVGGL
jgi:ArsR family transcriptional regulator